MPEEMTSPMVACTLLLLFVFPLIFIYLRHQSKCAALGQEALKRGYLEIDPGKWRDFGLVHLALVHVEGIEKDSEDDPCKVDLVVFRRGSLDAHQVIGALKRYELDGDGVEPQKIELFSFTLFPNYQDLHRSPVFKWDNGPDYPTHYAHLEATIGAWIYERRHTPTN